MRKRALGETGILVSALGLGTVKWGRNTGVHYPTPFALPTDETLRRLLSIAASSGINLLDTAPAYGTSEARLGKLLKGQRHDWVIASKAGETFVNGQSFFDFSRLALIESVEQSLVALKTDYLDILLVHSSGEDEAIIENDSVFETLAELKAAGKIRAFGMSTKTVRGGLLTIDHADLAMVTYHPAYTDEVAVIDYAQQKKRGIFIKKALASGHAPVNKTYSVTESLQFIFNHPGVTSVIIGTIDPAHLAENIKKSKQTVM